MMMTVVMVVMVTVIVIIIVASPVTNCYNISLYVFMCLFFVLGANKAVISSIGVLQSDCACSVAL
jgi:hypothetical protein